MTFSSLDKSFEKSYNKSFPQIQEDSYGFELTVTEKVNDVNILSRL